MRQCKCSNSNGSAVFNSGRFVVDKRVPDNEMWVCDGEEIKEILYLDTNEVKKLSIPIVLSDCEESLTSSQLTDILSKN